MAAILCRNDPSGKHAVFPDDLKFRQPIICDASCRVSYTLACGASHSPIRGRLNGRDVLIHNAAEVVRSQHPWHEVETYLWGGAQEGWLTSEQAKAAGL
jgi:hypothetical protein